MAPFIQIPFITFYSLASTMPIPLTYDFKYHVSFYSHVTYPHALVLLFCTLTSRAIIVFTIPNFYSLNDYEVDFVYFYPHTVSRSIGPVQCAN